MKNNQRNDIISLFRYDSIPLNNINRIAEGSCIDLTPGVIMQVCFEIVKSMEASAILKGEMARSAVESVLPDGLQIAE